MKTSKILQHPICLSLVIAGLSVIPASKANAQTIIPTDQWNVMQTVGNASPQALLYYLFTDAATNPVSVTCQFQTSTYSPGSYEAGYVSSGWISLDMGDGHTDGTAILEIDKYYSYPWSQAYTQVLLGNDGRGANMGTYAPGGVYTITFTWDRVGATIQINVTGPTSCSRTVSSNGRGIVRLTFHGGYVCNCGMDSQPAKFGNVSVVTPTPPVPPELQCAGFQFINGTNLASLTWTNNGTACVLESATSLTGAWSTATASSVTNGNWITVQITNNGAAQFFRLRGL